MLAIFEFEGDTYEPAKTWSHHKIVYMLRSHTMSNAGLLEILNNVA